MQQQYEGIMRVSNRIGKIVDSGTGVHQSLLDSALDYHKRGWTVLPVLGKKTLGRWKAFQNCRPDETTVRRLFARHPNATGIAALTGSASGGLACRDFDDLAAYWKWANEYPELAAALPTASTCRGFHIWFRHTTDEFIELDDGEFRADPLHYTLLPPSRHPDGPFYSWAVPLPDGPLPVLDPVQAGLIPFGCKTRLRIFSPEEEGPDPDPVPLPSSPPSPPQPHRHKNPQIAFVGQKEISEVDEGVGVEELITQAITATLPAKPGERNRRVFELARALRGIPALTDAAPADLKSHVLRWWKAARPFIGTKDWGETWQDFVVGWGRVRVPRYLNRRLFLKSVAHMAAAEPEPAAAERYAHPKVRLLVAVCRALQRLSREGSFYLDRRTAAQLVGMECDRTAGRWLKQFVLDGVLELVRGGLIRSGPDGAGGSGFATEYRFTGE